MDFGSLYAEYAPQVYRFALYLSGNKAVAEDLTSETFIRLWTAPEVRVATVKAFLLAICRNLYLQERRRRPSEPLDPTLRDPRPGPEATASDREELGRVLQRLRALPELDRSALLMRVQHELSYDDIAAALDMTAGAVKVRVHRARLKLALNAET